MIICDHLKVAEVQEGFLEEDDKLFLYIVTKTIV